MSNVAQNNSKRPSARHAAEHKVIAFPRPSEPGLNGSTLYDAIRAELARAAAALRKSPDEAARALEVAVELLDSSERRIVDLFGVVEEAEENLSTAALAFASVDGVAERELLCGNGSTDRTNFNIAMRGALEDLRCVNKTIADITKEQEA